MAPLPLGQTRAIYQLCWVRAQGTFSRHSSFHPEHQPTLQTASWHRPGPLPVRRGRGVRSSYALSDLAPDRQSTSASPGAPARSRTSPAGLEGLRGASAPRIIGTGSTSRTRLAGFGGPPAPGAPGKQEGRRIFLLRPLSGSSTSRWRVTCCHLSRQRPQGDTRVGGRA